MFPFSLWILLIGVVILASIASKEKRLELGDGTVITRHVGNSFCVLLILISLIYYSANTIANDVYIYRANFTRLPNLSWSELYAKGTGNNPLFGFIQVIFKDLISNNPAHFQLFEAAIVQTCFLLFFRRYSPSLTLTLFMFIASGLFYFSMVSWKQSLAMGIGLVSIPLIQQKKHLLFTAILLISMLIHPYIIMYGILIFLIDDKVWTPRNVLIIAAMCVAGFELSSILGGALEMTESVFGDKYDTEWLMIDNSVSWQRILFFSITPALSIIYRKRLDAHPYPLMNGFIQMSVISFGFMLMSMSGGANFISRMGTYFEPFTYIALPYILLKIIPVSARNFILWSVIILYLVFFAFSRLKWGSVWC